MVGAVVNGPGCAVTPAAEEGLTALLRARVQAAAESNPRGTVTWQRPERSAEREDLRARRGLDRAAFEQLPSGRPWRATVRSGRIFRRARQGVAMGVLVAWNDLARAVEAASPPLVGAGSGGDAASTGEVTVADAIAWYEREHEQWRRHHGSKPFCAVAAGAFRGIAAGDSSPLPNLALITWQNGEWHFHGRAAQPELADLFFPRAPEKSAPPARWKRMSTLRERLLSPFRNHHRTAELKLAARTREFQDAKLHAAQLREEYELHAAAGDWSEEMLAIQLAKGKHALRKASLLHQQVKSLQENLQLLTTAKMGGNLIADAALPVAEDDLAKVDRAYYETQAKRQGAVRAERTLAETLLGEEPAEIDMLEKEPPPRRRMTE